MTSTRYHVNKRLVISQLFRFAELKYAGRCVAGGCSAFPDVEKGLVLHAIPSYNDDRPEARKRRKKWVDFVMVNKIDRPNTTPTVRAICKLAVYFSVFRPFSRFSLVYEGH